MMLEALRLLPLRVTFQASVTSVPPEPLRRACALPLNRVSRFNAAWVE